MIDDVDGFAPTAVLIGEGFRADRIWTRDEFLRLCDLDAKWQSSDEFLQVYCDQVARHDLLRPSLPTSKKESPGRGTRSPAKPKTK